MATNNGTANGRPATRRRKGKEQIKSELIGTDPTRDYHSTRFTYYGELFVTQLPQWRLWTGRMMLTSDPIVNFSLNVRNAALMPAEVIVTAKNPIVKKWVEEQWKFLWDYHRTKLTNAKRWGFNPLQVLYKQDRTGLLVINGCKEFAPEDARALEAGGRQVGERIKGQQMYFPQALWLTFNAEFGSPYGTGCLRRSYPAWYEKWMDHGAKRLLQLRMTKDAYIGDIFWYPPNMLVTLPDGTQLPWRDMLREIGENRLSGGALTLPRLLDSNGKPLTDYTPPQDVSGGSQIFDWVQHCDENIMYGADVPIEVAKASDTGSGYSGRSIPFLVVLSVCTQELAEIVQCVCEQVLRPCAWLNWGGDVEFEIQPRSLVESFSQDTSGSAMAGSAIGSPAQGQVQGQQPLQVQGQQQQFAEDVPSVSKILGKHGFTKVDKHRYKKGDHEIGTSTRGDWNHYHKGEYVSSGSSKHEIEAYLHSNGLHSSQHSEQFGESYNGMFTAEPGTLAHEGLKHFHKAVRQYKGKVLGGNKFTIPAKHLAAFHNTADYTGFVNNTHYKILGKTKEKPAASQHSEEPAPEPEKHQFSCCLFNLPSELGWNVWQLSHRIDAEHLVERENQPHVTVLFGLHTDSADSLEPQVTALAPIAIQLGPCTCFHGEEGKPDVLKIDVISKGLHALHEELCKQPHTKTHPEYHPHITVAYVKPGWGAYYAQRLNDLEGKVAVFDRMIFSNKLREHYPIRLTGQAQFDEKDPPHRIGHKVRVKPTAARLHGSEGIISHIYPRPTTGGSKVATVKMVIGGKNRHPNFDLDHLEILGSQHAEEVASYAPFCQPLQLDEVKNHQHAPPGGVTIGGVFYKGGEYIPASVMKNLTEKEFDELVEKTKEGKDQPHPYLPLTHVETLGGSSNATLVTTGKGSKAVKKSGANLGQILNEAVTNKLYSVMGVLAPASAIHKEGDQTFLLSPHVEGKQLGSLSGDEKKSVIAKLGKNFVADALLANWDVIGQNQDNILVDKNGTPWRIDNGGATAYRAKGMPKGSLWNENLTELQSMRNQGQAGVIFKDITDADVAEQAKEILKHKTKLKAVSDDPVFHARLDKLEKMYGPNGSELAPKTAPVPSLEPVSSTGIKSFLGKTVQDRINKLAGMLSGKLNPMQIKKIAYLNHGEDNTKILVPKNSVDLNVIKAAFPDKAISEINTNVHFLKKFKALGIASVKELWNFPISDIEKALAGQQAAKKMISKELNEKIQNLPTDNTPHVSKFKPSPGYSAPHFHRVAIKSNSTMESLINTGHQHDPEKHANFVASNNYISSPFHKWKGSAKDIRMAELGVVKRGAAKGDPTAMNNLHKELAKAPSYEGIVYRGVSHITPGTEEWAALETLGSTVQFKCSSCTSRSNKKAAEGFAHGDTPVLYRMAIKTGVAIEGIDGHSDEREVIARKGVKYKVVGVAKQVQIGHKQVHMVVDLEEITSEPTGEIKAHAFTE